MKYLVNFHHIAGSKVRLHLFEQQSFKGSKTENKDRIRKITADQKQRPEVKCEGENLENVFKFTCKYLGSIFAADGSQMFDIERRVALAMRRCGQLRQFFDSDVISLRVKINIYKAAVMSLMTYGNEAWSLNSESMAKINGANARCISRITGKSSHQEASARTQTYNIIKALRRRRFKWLGHILRMEENRLVQKAVKVQYEKGDFSNMLLDAPNTNSFDELRQIASDRNEWKRLAP